MKQQTDLDFMQRVRLVEQRYEVENQLMELVRKGRGQKLQQILISFSFEELERRADTLRDVRNYSIILNTLMRKAAEQGGVPLLYIDQLSSVFALRIEKTVQWAAFQALWSDMAKDYCGLVRKHTAGAYSPLIQKAIYRIDFDLTADLSLHATANFLNVNPSYLSTQFKKETGKTFTDYVLQKRMEHAAYLLSSTGMRVSAVAQSCGISDDNYFTKLFKRVNGLTPLQYRKQQHNES